MRGPARGDAAEAGMTLVELMLLTAIISVVCYTFTRFITSTRQASVRQEGAGELLQRDLRSVTNLRAGLQGCVELVANYGDSTGDAMLPLHNMVLASVNASASLPTAGTGCPGPVAFSAWPTVEDANEVDTNGPSDPGAIQWGDEIMYVAELNPVTFTAYYDPSGSNWVVVGSDDKGTTTNAEILSVQRLQFVYDYLSWDTRTAVAGSGHGLRLTEWRSQPLIDYTSLNSLTDSPGTYGGNTCCPRMAAACQYLTSTGYTMAFNPANVTLTSNCSTCFYPLQPESSVYSPGVPIALPTSLLMYSWAYLDDFDLVQSYGAKPGVDLGRINRADGNSSGQTSAPGGYSIALDTSGASTSTSVISLQGPGNPLQVPVYAEANYTMPTSAGSMGGTGFPAGFEVAIDGTDNSREIFLRLVMLASNAGTLSPGVFQAQDETSEISVATQSDF
jgi:type II secretory pathway pseudopilin PulG